MPRMNRQRVGLLWLIAVFCHSTATRAGDEAALFPLGEGYRWIYVGEDGAEFEMHVRGRETVNGVKVFILHPGWTETGFGPDSLLSVERNRLVAYGSSAGSKRVIHDPPSELLHWPLTKDETWECKYRRIGDHVDWSREGAFKVDVVGVESVSVPAGTFDAWKVRTTNTANPRIAHEITSWFAPGVGPVRAEYWSYPTDAQLLELFPSEPHVLELAMFELGLFARCAEYLEHPKRDRVCELLGRLRDASDDDAPTVIRDLQHFGDSLFPTLFEVRTLAGTGRFYERVNALIESFGRLSVIGRASSEKCKVEQRLPVEFRLRNDFAFPITVLPALDASDVGRCPRYIIEVQREDGSLVDIKPSPRCGGISPLSESSFLELLPGHEANPLCMPVAYDPRDPGVHQKETTVDWIRHYVLRWAPTEPGTYRVRCIYDASARPNDWCWKGDLGENAPNLVELLRRMPRGRFESNPVTVTVEP